MEKVPVSVYLTFSLFQHLFGLLSVSLADPAASVYCLRAAAQLGVGIPLGFRWGLFPIGVGLVFPSTYRVEGLGSDGEALARRWEAVLWCWHGHETHPEVLAGVCPVGCHGNIFTNPKINVHKDKKKNGSGALMQHWIDVWVKC